MLNYKTPPIIEIVCEFEFPDSSEWDSAIPGLIYAEAEDRFPIREQRRKSIISCPIPQETSIEAIPGITKQDVTVFLNKNKNIFIQVGARNISLNQLKTYSNWNDFKNNLEYIFNICRKLVAFDAMENIRLHYTNLIEIPEKVLELEDYFEIRPFLGENLPQSTVSFMIGCVFMFNAERDICKVTLVDAVPKNEDSTAFVLNIDYSLLNPRSVPVDQTLRWIEDAHGEIEKLFDGCTSDKLKALFGVGN